MTQTLSQRRAAKARTLIREVAGQPWKKAYLAEIESLPANILIGGFGQAVAMLSATAAKDKKPNGASQLLSHLENWLCTECDHSPYSGKADLLAAIVEMDQDAYVRGRNEALAFTAWLKRLAQAFLKDAAGPSNASGGRR